MKCCYNLANENLKLSELKNYSIILICLRKSTTIKITFSFLLITCNKEKRHCVPSTVIKHYHS